MSPKLRLGVALLSTCLIFYIVLGSLLDRVLGDTTYGQLALFNEVVRTVLDSYVEPVNLDRAMAGANLGLGDALDGESAYLESADLRTYQQGMQESGDVGLSLARRFSFVIVASVRPGSPAEKAKLKPGDVVKSIDGRHSRTLSVPLAMALLRGAPGSVVKLKMLRARNEVTDVDLTREKSAPLPAQNRILEDGIGYLKIQEFTSHTPDEVESALETLSRGGARKLALDLRGALGSPEEAVKVAPLFIKDGVVSRLVSRHAGEQEVKADGSIKWTHPIAVLIDSTTGGPGEILAAALSDSGRGSLVGERTIGRAAQQKTVPVEGGAFILTVAKYVSPKGQDIHGKGLEPAVAVQTREEEADDDSAADDTAAPDAILQKALEVLKGEAARRAA